MSALGYATFFEANSKKDLKTSADSLERQIGILPLAHSSMSYWVSSLTYPIWHLVKAAVNAVQI